MTRALPFRVPVPDPRVCVLFAALCLPAHAAQTDQSPTAQLLGKAHALELRGRFDMAREAWQQVLAAEPNNAEALAGLAHAARLAGKNVEADAYFSRLRAVNPNDPALAQLQPGSRALDHAAKLKEAEQLAETGQYTSALSALQSIYGDNPPPGEAALSFYAVEGAAGDRAGAVAGLRALADRYPHDARYAIALGQVLTYNPRTRAEGRKLLQAHSGNPEAAEALHQSQLWNVEAAATAAEIRVALVHHFASSAPSAPLQMASAAQQMVSSSQLVASSSQQLSVPRLQNPSPATAPIASTPARPAPREIAASRAPLTALHMPPPGTAASLNVMLSSGAPEPRQPAPTFDRHPPPAAAPSAHADWHAPHDPRYDAAMKLAGAALAGHDAALARRQFELALRRQPASPSAWHGLVAAEHELGNDSGALVTNARIPIAVRQELDHDPAYLQTLAAVYSALGRTADARTVLLVALSLPYGPAEHASKIAAQMSYAALLVEGNDVAGAAVLYRQILAEDTTNLLAWEALIAGEHRLGQDAAALASLQSMPATFRPAVMADPATVLAVAAAEEKTGHPDRAQAALEALLAAPTKAGARASAPAQLQLAVLYMAHAEPVRAYLLYRAVLASTAGTAEAWGGLLRTLHLTGHDEEALAQLDKVPPAVRAELERDPLYLRDVGEMYNALHYPQNAILFWSRADAIDAARHQPPPADVALQEAGALFSNGNAAGLYAQLTTLGSRTDLTEPQRRSVQEVWVSWTLQRAAETTRSGDRERGLALLTAAVKTFPANRDLLKAQADSYTGMGQPRQAEAIFRAEDLSRGSVAEYGSAIAAALAAKDSKQAESWLRAGLSQYPRNPEMLKLGGQFEEHRKRAALAAEYYKASEAARAHPPSSSDPAPAQPPSPVHLPSAQQGEELARLLGSPATPASPTPAGSTPISNGSRRGDRA